MVIYFGYCKTEEEGRALQNHLRAVCPTLIYSRLLTRPHELDVYNTELLRSSDDQIAPGLLTFSNHQIALTSPMRTLLFWLALLLVAGWAAALLSNRVLSTPENLNHKTITALATGLLVLALLFGWIVSRTIRQFTPARRAVWRAGRMLAHGRPVLLAASDSTPEGFLPPNVHFFLSPGEEDKTRASA